MRIIHTPSIVQNGIEKFVASLFKNEPQRKHISTYLTGLMLSDNKTIIGITDVMVNASDQSALNRFLTQVDWYHDEMNKKRIEWLQQFDDTYTLYFTLSWFLLTLTNAGWSTIITNH